MLKIKDNLFIKSEIKCIIQWYNKSSGCPCLDVKFIDGSVEVILNATIDDVIDLDKKGD